MRAFNLVVILSGVLLSAAAGAQPIDRTNAPPCSGAENEQFRETNTKYQGVRGRNPAAPSTYNLIGDHKFSGTGLSIATPFIGDNWYPIRTEKQTLTGTFHDFGIANFGDESDWNIHLVPAPGFESFVADAIVYREDASEWFTNADGRVMVEAEITPDERRYGNPWFDNREGTSPLLNKRLTVYGPFVFEEIHGNRPEIHPAEQIWWKDGANATVILLVVDDSNRFKQASDYSTRRATTPNVPWTQENGQQAELKIAFEVDPLRSGLYMSVQALDDLDFFKNASFADASPDNPIVIQYRGNAVLAVQKSAAIDPFVGVTFQSICVNAAKRTLQGYVVLNTATGNGSGKEGFVALRVDTREAGFNSKPAIFTGDLLNTWKAHAPYDNRVPPADIISSDMRGMGVVDGLIDFNGNGKSDLFAKVGESWMVLFDARDTWQQINTSSVAVSELRFDDIVGDRKTDILRVGPDRQVQASLGGTGQWITITEAGEQNSLIQVGDFNGDAKTDIVYFKVRPSFQQTPPPVILADMYVKLGASGSWKRLNNGYQLRDFEEYRKTFRFGDFNGDGITDVFRFRDGRFGVYWSGAGDFKELHKPSFAIDVDDLLFVPDLTTSPLTDVVHINRNSKKWTVFPGGKPGTLPLTMKYADPAIVRFGDVDPDPAVEPFAVDLLQERRSPADVAMTIVPKAIIDPVVFTRYVPGSVRRVQHDDRVFLTASYDVRRSPGTAPRNRKGEELRSISAVTAGGRSVAFKRAAALETPRGEVELLGTIENVPLDAAEETSLAIAFGAATTPTPFELPAHAITAIPGLIVEEAGTASASWMKWQGLLARSSSAKKQVLLESPPAQPARVETVAFELAPVYSSVEEGKVRVIEMDDVARELNDIAYGSNGERTKQIFGERPVFAIAWQFELTNMTTGTSVPIDNPGALVADGRWPSSRVRLRFPEGDDLLRFKASATITDQLGHRSIEPIEVVFWNQRILLTAPNEQLATWIRHPLAGVDTPRLLVKAKFLAEDGILTPSEVQAIMR